MKKVVERLHERGVIHGDIKLSIMLLCSDGKVHLCDFAGAALVEDNTNRSPIRTVEWTSPYRAIHNMGQPIKENDLYALGVSIWELYTGYKPFQGMNSSEAKKLMKGGQSVDISKIDNEQARDVVGELMSPMLQKTSLNKIKSSIGLEHC